MTNGLIGVHNSLSTWKQGDLPRDPTVQLVLNQDLGLKKGFAVLTATLSSDSEIDEAVDLFIKDFESAARQAKKTLRTQRDKMV